MSFISHLEIPASEDILPCPKASIKKIHDPSDYTAVTPKPAQRWTVEQKTVLFILKQHYELSWTDVKILLRELFRSELSSPVGPSTAAIRSMYHGIKEKGYASTGPWILIREAIERKALQLGIELGLKDARFNDLSDSLLDNELVSGDESDSTLLGDEYSLPLTPSKFSRNRPIRGVLEIGRPKSSSLQDGHASGREIPRIGFRTFTPESQGINGAEGFVAGLFVNKARIAQPDPTSREFENEAVRHVAKVHTGSTPFISVTSSLIRSLHVAFKNPTTSTIAFIDLHKAGTLSASEGDQPSTPKVHWVRSLKLNTGYTYQGGSELLVWGEIPKDAILSTVSLAQILAYTSSIPGRLDLFQLRAIQVASTTTDIRIKLSRHRLMQTCVTGTAVGTLAKKFSVPAELLDLFVQLVVKEWKFRGDNWEKNDDFIKGVLGGFEKEFAAPRPQPRVFEDFIDSLERLRGFVKTEGLPEGCEITDNDVTMSNTQQPERSRDGSVAQNALNKEPINSIQQIKPDPEGGEQHKMQLTSFDTPGASFQDDKTDAIRPELESSGPSQPGQWREIHGYGRYAIRVYESMGNLGESSRTKSFHRRSTFDLLL